MSKFLIEQIRNAICKTGKQKPRAAELSDEQLLQVFDRLRRGQSPNEIARHAQNSWNFMKDKSPHTCGQALRVLQKRISHLLILGSLPAESPPTNPYSVTVNPEGLEGLQKLHSDLLSRTFRLLDQEKTTGRPYRDAAKDAISISTVAKTLMKAKEFELSKLDPLEVKKQIELKIEIKKHFDELMKGITDAERIKVAAALDGFGKRFLELAEKDAITMEEAESGTWKH